MASYLKVHKPRAKLLVMDANPEITSKKGLFERAFKDHYAGLLEYRPNAELKEVNLATRSAKFDFEEVKADVLNVVPPQRAGDIARQAGLVNVNVAGQKHKVPRRLLKAARLGLVDLDKR